MAAAGAMTIVMVRAQGQRVVSAGGKLVAYQARKGMHRYWWWPADGLSSEVRKSVVAGIEDAEVRGASREFVASPQSVADAINSRLGHRKTG